MKRILRVIKRIMFLIIKIPKGLYSYIKYKHEDNNTYNVLIDLKYLNNGRRIAQIIYQLKNSGYSPVLGFRFLISVSKISIEWNMETLF